MSPDVLGNYLFQKLVETATDEQRTAIVKAVEGELEKAAFHVHGTRSVQTIVEELSSPEQVSPPPIEEAENG